MSKTTKSINLFKCNALDKNSQHFITGGKLSKEQKKIEKLLKKLEKALAKADHKNMFKAQDELDCLGYSSSLSCCGNGLGTW